MVDFVVTQICDTRKSWSTVAIGKVLKGLLAPSGKQIFFSDSNGQDWIFYIGDTCELKDQFAQRFNSYLIKLGYPEAESVNVYDTGVEAVIATAPVTEHFSNWNKLSKNRYFVRLSSGDYFNHTITQGLF